MMYFDLEKAMMVPLPDDFDRGAKHDHVDTQQDSNEYAKILPLKNDDEYHHDLHASRVDHQDDHYFIKDNPIIVTKTTKNKTIALIPFILYIVLSIVVLFCFLIQVDNFTITLVYFLIQAIFVIGIGCVIYWMAIYGSVAWAWIIGIVALVIQVLWVLMVIYY